MDALDLKRLANGPSEAAPPGAKGVGFGHAQPDGEEGAGPPALQDDGFPIKASNSCSVSTATPS